MLKIARHKRPKKKKERRLISSDDDDVPPWWIPLALWAADEISDSSSKAEQAKTEIDLLDDKVVNLKDSQRRISAAGLRDYTDITDKYNIERRNLTAEVDTTFSELEDYKRQVTKQTGNLSTGNVDTIIADMTSKVSDEIGISTTAIDYDLKSERRALEQDLELSRNKIDLELAELKKKRRSLKKKDSWTENLLGGLFA
jgi:hypothetical protein